MYDACMASPSASAATESPLDRRTAVDSVLVALIGIGRLMRQSVGGDVLDPGSMWLLKTLNAHGSMRISELAGWVNLDASTVSRHVSQLQGLGLVERTADPDDGRAYLLVITDDGDTKLQQAFERRRQLLARCVQDWDGADLEELDRLLSRFVADIESTDLDLENT